MSTGTISCLVRTRGFGFIRCASGQEVFFHRSQVQGAPFELLAPGQSAVFRVGLGAKGLQAVDVKPSPLRKPEG